MLSLPLAHLICVALVVVDIAARAWRIKWILAGIGNRISFVDAFRLNAYGDAACALTPLRFGGEPARLAGMLAARVPAPAALVAIGIEVLAAWPVILAVAIPLGILYAPDWWATAAPRLADSVTDAWPWIVLILAACVAAWLAARRITHPLSRQLRRPISRVRVYWRRIPAGPVLASIPMTLLNLAARVGILVVLVRTLPDPAPLGTLLIGSFALLYAQLVVPTPSGAGVVDFGFLGGAVGSLGGQEASLLLAWRFYTSGAGMLLGILLAGGAYGWPALRRLATGRAASPFKPRPNRMGE